MSIYFGAHAITRPIRPARYSVWSAGGDRTACMAVRGRFWDQNRLLRRSVGFRSHKTRDTAGDTSTATAMATGVHTGIRHTPKLAYPVLIEIAQEVMPEP